MLRISNKPMLKFNRGKLKRLSTSTHNLSFKYNSDSIRTEKMVSAGWN